MVHAFILQIWDESTQILLGLLLHEIPMPSSPHDIMALAILRFGLKQVRRHASFSHIGYTAHST